LQAVTKKGGRYLEAPVSGTKQPAEQGKLIFLTGGDEVSSCCPFEGSDPVDIAVNCAKLEISVHSSKLNISVHSRKSVRVSQHEDISLRHLMQQPSGLLMLATKGSDKRLQRVEGFVIWS
jgi:hypothetical protein